MSVWYFQVGFNETRKDANGPGETVIEDSFASSTFESFAECVSAYKNFVNASTNNVKFVFSRICHRDKDGVEYGKSVNKDGGFQSEKTTRWDLLGIAREEALTIMRSLQYKA